LRLDQAGVVRDACLGWLPFGGLLAWLGDPVVKRWMRRSSPYAGEIDEVARFLKRPGIWLLHGAYLFGCTALADETTEGPRLRRTLDWPFPGRAPMRQRASINALLWSDYVLNALAGLRAGAAPPEHLLRQVFDACASFDEARRLLETVPVARPVLFLLVGCRPGERVIIERDGTERRTYRNDTTVANDWQEARPGWRPRCCGEGTPVDNNRRRRSTLAAWAGRTAPTRHGSPVLSSTNARAYRSKCRRRPVAWSSPAGNPTGTAAPHGSRGNKLCHCLAGAV
jgi:hypothetical protein